MTLFRPRSLEDTKNDTRFDKCQTDKLTTVVPLTKKVAAGNPPTLGRVFVPSRHTESRY